MNSTKVRCSIKDLDCVISKRDHAGALRCIVSGYVINVFTRVQARWKKSNQERIQSDRLPVTDIAWWQELRLAHSACEHWPEEWMRGIRAKEAEDARRPCVLVAACARLDSPW